MLNPRIRLLNNISWCGKKAPLEGASAGAPAPSRSIVSFSIVGVCC